MTQPHAVIFGVGDGLSAAIARNLAPDYELTLAARSNDKMQSLVEDLGARAVLLDVTDVVLSRLRSGLSTPLGSLSFEGQGAFAAER